jgi:hypothetical protein
VTCRQSWFLFASACAVASGFIVWSFRHQRRYYIDVQRGTYHLANIGIFSESMVVESTLNNIYIRLRKRHGTGVCVEGVRTLTMRSGASRGSQLLLPDPEWVYAEQANHIRCYSL